MATLSVLVVGGGGGGGAHSGGGGGGGAVVYNASFTATTLVSKNYTVVVGGGGLGATWSVNQTGANGGNSSFDTITAVGGGGGGGRDYGSAQNGACGGGCPSDETTPIGTGSVGYNGGTGYNVTPYTGGGGGGMGSAGGNANATKAGNGGNGVSYDISGSTQYYGGGGGGGCLVGTTAYGTGTHGGGRGGDDSNGGADATANTGSGGGGGGRRETSAAVGKGGNGGSGIVIVRYLTSDFVSCTGGTITIDGNYTIHTFTSSGTFTVSIAHITKSVNISLGNIAKTMNITQSNIMRMVNTVCETTVTLTHNNFSTGGRLTKVSDGTFAGWICRAEDYFGANQCVVGRWVPGTTRENDRTSIGFTKPSGLTSSKLVSAVLNFSSWGGTFHIYGITANPTWTDGNSLWNITVTSTGSFPVESTGNCICTDLVKAVLDAGTTLIAIRSIHPSDLTATDLRYFNAPTLTLVYVG